MFLSEAALKVLAVSMSESLVPRLKEIVDEVAAEVAHEDNPQKVDLFVRDYAAQMVILELIQYLAQGEVEEEDWAPILRPHQLAPEYAKQWWGVEK